MLGEGQVLKGWDLGIPGMCKGEKRKILIPSSLGFGEKGVQGSIPRLNLYFDNYINCINFK